MQTGHQPRRGQLDRTPTRPQVKRRCGNTPIAATTMASLGWERVFHKKVNIRVNLLRGLTHVDLCGNALRHKATERTRRSQREREKNGALVKTNTVLLGVGGDNLMLILKPKVGL